MRRHSSVAGFIASMARAGKGSRRLADWNVVATVRGRGFVEACRVLEPFGELRRTGYYNVLVMRVEDPARFLEEFGRRVAMMPSLPAALGHVAPLSCCFDFRSPEEFEAGARACALGFLPRLAGASFHVRLSRRGFKGRLSSPEEERFLDDVLLEALERSGTPGRIAFDDPDAVVHVETVDSRAGLALYTRDDFARYPFLKRD